MTNTQNIARVALVTAAGSTGGLGKAIAERLARAGNIVAVNDMQAAAASDTVEKITLAGGRAAPFAADVSKASAVRSMVDAIVARYGRIDILVNCVGIRTKALIGELPEDEIARVLTVNLGSIILCIDAVAPIMKKQRYGRIVSIGSTAGRRGGGEFNTSTSIYAASKAGISGFSRSVALELGRFGITSNVIAPFLIDVPGRSHGRSPEVVEDMLRAIPAGRLGTPDDVAACIAFLASEEAGYVNGVELDVNGGWHRQA